MRHCMTQRAQPLSGSACAGQYKVQHLLQALSEMAHTDDGLAHSLWVLLLPIIWATLGEKKDQQVSPYFLNCTVRKQRLGATLRPSHEGHFPVFSTMRESLHGADKPRHRASVAL